MQLGELERKLSTGEAHPRDVKMALAREIVTIFHDAEAGQSAEQDFIRKFQERGVPDDMPVETLNAPERVAELLARLKMVSSKGEAKRLIKSGGVRIDGEQAHCRLCCRSASVTSCGWKKKRRRHSDRR